MKFTTRGFSIAPLRAPSPSQGEGPGAGVRAIAMLAAAALIIPLAGCASPFVDEAWRAPRPLGADLATYRPPVKPEAAADAVAPDPSGVLTLGEALALALARSPELAGDAYDVRIAEARALQASLVPNPVGGVMVENFAGSGPFDGSDNAMTTLRISQLIELAGKREKRTAVARGEAALAGWDYETQRLALLVTTASRFIDVLANQRRLELARQQLELAEAVHRIVSDRAAAGVVAGAERDRSAVRVSQERIALERIERRLTASRHQLAAIWGAKAVTFDGVAGDLDALAAVPGYEALSLLAVQNPRIARWDDEIAQRRAAIALEQSQAIPDVSVGPGIRYMNDIDERAMVVEAMVELPIFDRNQGNILAARYALARARFQKQAAEAAVQQELATALSELSAAYRTATILRDETLPAARSAFEAARDAFRAGATDFINVLDAQRTYIDVEQQYLDALAEYHTARNTVDGLVGEPVAGPRAAAN